MRPHWYHRIYRIHPGIGVARIGNSELEGTDGHFIGPEVPDVSFVPPPKGQYRDKNDDIRRQGVRVRIYEYTYRVGQPAKLIPVRPPHHFVREITAKDADIDWHVHLANRKSKNVNGQQVNDPGEKTIGGLHKHVEVVGAVLGDKVKLGTLLTDGAGRLVLLGGHGRSRSPSGALLGGLFNSGWYDDVSDGSVRATIKLKKGGAMPTVEPAWVIVGVPGFAHPITSIVSLYDLAYDVATRLPPPNALTPPTLLSFTRHIYPMLIRPVMMQWVSQMAQMGHSGAGGGNFLDPARFNLLKDNNTDPSSSAYQERQFVFQQLKAPDGSGTGDMPKLWGLSVTQTQYDAFAKWAAGTFAADWVAPPVVTPFSQLTPLAQTRALDRTGLWTSVGGAFYPGIEACVVMNDPKTYESPFRIRHTLVPGALTEQLSVPWAADYTACGTGWWPGGRPNEVTQDGTTFYEWLNFGSMDKTVTDWWKLGFIAKKTVKGTKIYAETE